MDKALLEKVGEVVSEETLQELLNEWNPIVHVVDRTVRPAYSDLVREVKYPKLELAGPADFDVRELKLCFHSKQEKGVATGNEIFEKLIVEKLLDGCLNLADILAIQKRGGGFYGKHFSGLIIPAWKSVVLSRGGGLSVPYLCENGYEVELNWSWLGRSWDSRFPALRLASAS